MLTLRLTLILSLVIVQSYTPGCSDEDSTSPDTTYTPILPNESPGTGTQYPTVVEAFSFVNSAGNSIYGQIRRPDPAQYPANSFAAVIKIPGGINPGRMEVLAPEAIALAESGMVVVCFNAEGRVDDRTADDIRSEGDEHYNGFRNQETLAELFNYVSQLPYTISDNIGFRTQSYGISMGAGCAARHPELKIKYIVDGEGPPSSFVTVQEPWALFSPPEHPNHNKYLTVYGILGHYSLYRDSSAANHSFWDEREAIRFIGAFNGMYLRLQGQWDHSQPPLRAEDIPMFHKPPLWWQSKHTCDIVNTAVAGGVPWVRVNLPQQNNPVNATFDADNLPRYIPGELNDSPMVPVSAILEMAGAEPVRRPD